MASNRGVAYIKPGVVEIQSIDFPKLVNPTNNKKAEHGVILKIISTNICGSDQHMVRGRTTAPAGLVLGHEITGEVIEAGRDVEFLKKGRAPNDPTSLVGRLMPARGGNAMLDDTGLGDVVAFLRQVQDDARRDDEGATESASSMSPAEGSQ